MAQRFARHAFPDTLENDVLGPLRASCRSRLGKSSEAGALLEAREGIFVRYSESAVEVVLVIAQARTVAHDRFAGSTEKIEQRVKAGLDQIMRPVAKAAGSRDPSWTVKWKAVFPENMPFADFLP